MVENLKYDGENYQSGKIYLSAREKEMISEMIFGFYANNDTSKEEAELMERIEEKIGETKQSKI